MSFQITCNKCAALLNVDEKNIGKTGKCFKCGNRIEIISPNNDKQNDTLIENKPKRAVRSATEKQKEFARDLGIEFDENINMREISKLIDAALAREEALTPEEIELHLKTLPKSSPDEMIDEIQRRGLWTL
jgi:DNA-directed RNA polymerase subunit M/transcription elongation factor TFIIS